MRTLQDIVTTALEIGGLALVVAAAFLVFAPLGIASAGAACLFVARGLNR